MKYIIFVLLSALIFFGFTSGNPPKKNGKNEVRIHLLNPPSILNPLNAYNANAYYIQRNVFQSLTAINPKTLQRVPVLAEELPTESIDTLTGEFRMTFRIRPEAKWDDGRNIIARDVSFSLKAGKCPGVDNVHSKDRFSMVKNIELYLNDPLKITIVFDKYSYKAINLFNEVFIIPQYIYDKYNYLSRVRIYEIDTTTSPIKLSNIDEFAKKFNKKTFEPADIIGSGPYMLTKVTGQDIQLSKKIGWWGEGKQKESPYFEAYPDKLIYRVILDEDDVLKAISNREIDITKGISYEAYRGLIKSRKLRRAYEFHTPKLQSYEYLGINQQKPLFNDILVRQALAYVVNYDSILGTIYNNFAVRKTGPISEDNFKYYNKNLTPYPFNLNKAVELLNKAGWDDTDGDGILDKEINGVKTDMSFELIFKRGSVERNNSCVYIREAARMAGIEIIVRAVPWRYYLDRLRAHDFDIFMGGWTTDINLPDLNNMWKTTSYSSGNNWIGFGNNKTDSLLNNIEFSIDDKERVSLVKEFQRIIHETVPSIYLLTERQCIMVNKRFTNTLMTPQQPGFWEAGFVLKK